MGCGSSTALGTVQHDDAAPRKKPSTRSVSSARLAVTLQVTEAYVDSLRGEFALLNHDDFGMVHQQELEHVGNMALKPKLQLGHRVLLSKLLLGMRTCKLRGFIDEADFVATLCNWRRMAFEEKVYLAIDMLEIPLDEPMAPGKLHNAIEALAPGLRSSAVTSVIESIVLESRVLLILLEGRHKDPEGPRVEITGQDLATWCIRCQTRVKIGIDDTMLDIEPPAAAAEGLCGVSNDISDTLIPEEPDTVNGPTTAVLRKRRTAASNVSTQAQTSGLRGRKASFARNPGSPLTIRVTEIDRAVDVNKVARNDEVISDEDSDGGGEHQPVMKKEGLLSRLGTWGSSKQKSGLPSEGGSKVIKRKWNSLSTSRASQVSPTLAPPSQSSRGDHRKRWSSISTSKSAAKSLPAAAAPGPDGTDLADKKKMSLQFNCANELPQPPMSVVQRYNSTDTPVCRVPDSLRKSMSL